MIDNNKKFDYLGFDPRGIGSTTPQADCFGGDVLARNTYEQVLYGVGPLDSSEDALRRSLELFKGRGIVCENTLAESGILEHVTTAAVCRDMVAIVDCLDEHQKNQVAALERRREADEDLVRIETNSEVDHVPRLQYLGLSYGTALGNTFASMFPGRVGRIVLDGVVNARDYMNNASILNEVLVCEYRLLLTLYQEWLGNLRDTEAVVDYFYNTCYDSGDHCALYTSSDTSGADIKQRVNQFIADLDTSPLHHVAGTSITAVTGNDIRGAISASIYQPIAAFAPLAQMISDALQGNFTLLAATIGPDSSQEECASGNQIMSVEAAYAIHCSDAAGNQTEHDDDLAYYSEMLEKYTTESDTFGAKWATIPFECAGYRLKPKDQFHGPWITPPADPSLKPGVPAAPLLFLTSRLDPVTPAINAGLMSAGHPGSAVVIQDSVGHCTIPAGWSDCTNKILQDYFEFGVVPENGTLCSASCHPWLEDPSCQLDLENTGGW
ncbi:hypothetical protein NM208_g10156 [Fusarium decemcellulare]|uniref:Uncharacterized protein n=1 Tax=Fusarium decemcellulare TaxID=57161 RepID=A0ACC1RYW7_9HYPO|nr:hypothetical protein NM208_g10156 [Fusarium decemcellulare]